MAWFKSDSDADRLMKDDFLDLAAQKSPAAASAALPVAGERTAPAARGSADSPLRDAAQTARPVAAGAVAPNSILGATLRFRGELRAEEDFTLQGRIEGSIHHTKSLTIGVDGVVKGDSRARTIVVEGAVEGDLYALESIRVMQTARVMGNIFAPRVAIAEGASFNGKVDMASATKAARSIIERNAGSTLSEAEVQSVITGT